MEKADLLGTIIIFREYVFLYKFKFGVQKSDKGRENAVTI